jgi:hypothetical protein
MYCPSFPEAPTTQTRSILIGFLPLKTFMLLILAVFIPRVSSRAARVSQPLYGITAGVVKTGTTLNAPLDTQLFRYFQNAIIQIDNPGYIPLALQQSLAVVRVELFPR